MPDVNVAGLLYTVVQGSLLLAVMVALFAATEGDKRLTTVVFGLVAVVALGGLVWTAVALG